MTDLGLKKITLDNWLVPEEIPNFWVKISNDSNTEKPYSCGDWVAEILKPQLSENVPEEIVSLFEVARGALVYGNLFYPLYTLW